MPSIPRKHVRLPPGKTLQFKQGWRAYEEWRAIDSHTYSPTGAYAREFAAGFNARAERDAQPAATGKES